MKKTILFLFALATALAPAAEKPLKLMLITGGCCHDYGVQKDLIKVGIEARLNAVVTQVHTDDKSTKPPLPILGDPEYAKDYDLVIHDQCAAGIGDVKLIEDVLKPHVDGLPAVALHCAMHSFRFGNFKQPLEVGAENGKWFEFLGLQSSGHGPRKPLDIYYVDKEHPISKGLPDWTTGDEELYNNIMVHEGTHALAKAKQGKNEAVVTWTNLYGPKKARVFCTTIGHFNETVADDRYLDLVARGILWGVGKLNDDGTPAAGYGAE
ncbi:ThuA domain-containing protein [Haloferula sp. A504]|uniref:ThuA domain-containing protein n=1 Tax=Haloferula sp. A504 TaxID=3373601 RepID=UPI0031BBD372|nr:ThuA domain-containing protein [Verrucomicrobiaceae bacterium E54]